MTDTTISAGLDTADAVRQSLATGSAGAVLLAIERAQAGTAPWTTAHARIRHLTTGTIDGGIRTGLYYGAPAVAFAVHCAATADTRYRAAAASLDAQLLRVATRRLSVARARLQRGDAATFGEYDVFYGLAGIGALLLRRAPGSDVLGDLLHHLVILTEPRRLNGAELPGWWVQHDPDPALPTPGGHANLGMAHGAAGILALLALSARHGHVVAHQTEAIHRLIDWFDRWRQYDEQVGIWWPQWLTRADLHTGQTHQPGPGLPSWCYGTPGIARALHLAAIAVQDPNRQAEAEHILAGCATDNHLGRLTDHGLCHGRAGLYQILHRAAADAHSPAIAQRLPLLAESVADHATTLWANPTQAPEHGLLTGRTGVYLAAHTAQHGTPRTGWDTCLLIT